MLGVCFFVGEYRDSSIQRPTFRDWNDLGAAFDASVMWIDHPSQQEFNPIYGLLDTQYPKLTQHPDLSSAIASTPNVPWVFVEYAETNATSLIDFTHPADVIYCFGSDGEGLRDVSRDLGDWISIPTKRALWANQAAAVVLGNRQFNDNNR